MTGPLLRIYRRLLLTAAIAILGQSAFLVCDASAQVRTISSLPYTVSTADNGYTLRLANRHMTATDRAITFAASVHDVTLELGNDTITWGTAGTTGTIGISMSVLSACYNITIHGGTILHSPPASTETPGYGLNATAFSISTRPYNITVRGTKFTIRGHDSQFFTHAGGAYNLEIDSCVFESFRESFTYRDQWKLSALNVFLGTVPMSMSGFLYTVKFTNNTFTSANWCNLYIEGPTLKALVYGNHFFTDGLNTYTSGTFSTAAQNYALSIRYGESGVTDGKSIVDCHDNTFRSGTSHSGGRGIFVSSIDGYSLHPDSSIFIHDNDIEVHQGWDEEERTLNGIIVRQGVSNIYIRDNIITCIGNANSPSSSYDVGPMACLRLTGSPTLDGVKIVGNTLTSYFIGGVSPDYGTSGPNGQGIIFDAYPAETPNVTIDSNTFNTDNVCIRWGFYNGNGGESVFRNNIYNYLSGDNGYVFQLYGASGSAITSVGNIDRDGTFTGGAAPTDVFLNDAVSTPMDIAVEVTLRVTVMGNNGLTVPGASVYITNAYGKQVGFLTTDSTGVVTRSVRHAYFANSVRGSDSTAYNLFTIKVKKAGDSTSISYSVGANTKSAVLTLSQTVGGGTAVDSIPPGDIIDFGATCDSLGRGIVLGWIAPGDDNSVGQAARYDIRYSSNSINESNFAAAGIVPNPPSPQPSGATEALLVTSLDENLPYYFALKAYDEAGLSSNLGDPAEYSPANIRAPTIDTVTVDQVNQLLTLYANPVRSCQQTYLEFQVDTGDAFSAPLVAVDSTPLSSASVTISGLLNNTVYYWRCRAITTDGLLASEFAAAEPMMPFVSLATGCDSVGMVDPIGGAGVSTPSPALTVRNASADANAYFFELDDQVDFLELVASGVVYQQEGEFTAWTVPSTLVAGETYYWRVHVNNCEFGSPASFVVSKRESFAFPNPFRPSAGQLLTFAGISANSDLFILTVSGDLVRTWSDTNGENIAWDGTNNSGHPVASGVYVWSVEPGALGGKIIVVR